MTFSYAAGDDTPDFSGLFELPTRSLRIGNVADSGVQPTFKPLVIPPLVSTAPIRYNVTPIPLGANVSDPIFDSWQFDVTGWFLMDDPDDVQAAFDYLCDAVCVGAGWMGVSLNALGWTEARTMTVRKAGPVAYGQNPDKGEMAAGYREFVLPFIAEDPIKYSTTEHSTTVTTSTLVDNAGNASVPWIARFDGPNADHIQFDSGLDDGIILLDYELGSGEFIEILTRDGTYVTNTGVDMYPYIAVGSGARLIPPAGLSLTLSSGSGGTGTAKHWDGWE